MSRSRNRMGSRSSRSTYVDDEEYDEVKEYVEVEAEEHVKVKE